MIRPIRQIALSLAIITALVAISALDQSRAGQGGEPGPQYAQSREMLVSVYDGAIANPVSPDLETFSELIQVAFPEKTLEEFFDGASHTTIFAPAQQRV